jgi:hypothetical protein
MATLTIAAIRAQYPRPMSGHDPKTHGVCNCYCVGGALCRAVALDCGLPEPGAFPTVRELAMALIHLNPALGINTYGTGLGLTMAWAYASIIIVANDGRRFAQAWHYAEQAEAYRRPPSGQGCI